MEDDPETPQKPSKGYSKRPLWLKILVYLIIAIILYGIIYLLFIHKSSSPGGGGGGGGGTPSGY